MALLPWLLLLFLLSCVSAILRKGKIRAKWKGAIGEFAVHHRALKRLGEDYRIYQDLYLPRPDGNGTTQIDHVVVSIFGIFVIETKNYDGWIFGSEQSRYWTQCMKGGAKFQFQNPLQQNKLHVNALKKALHLPAGSFLSVVYFVGDCTFKTSLPDNVIRRGLKDRVLSYRDVVLTREQVFRVCECLDSFKNERAALKGLHHPQGSRS